MPLQVTDPEHQFGHRGGAGVELDPEELVRIDGELLGLQALGLAHAGQRFHDFGLDALEMFQRDVEEVARAASGVEHAQVAQALVELLQKLGGFQMLATVGGLPGLGSDLLPFAAQRFDEGG